MGESLAKLAARVFVPRHKRVTHEGDIVDVEAYWRDMTPGQRAAVKDQMHAPGTAEPNAAFDQPDARPLEALAPGERAVLEAVQSRTATEKLQALVTKERGKERKPGYLKGRMASPGGRSLTVGDIDIALNDPRHSGYGYRAASGLPARKLETLNRSVAAVANELGYSSEDLFRWADSKHGRWLVDRVYGTNEPPTRATVRKEMNAKVTADLRAEEAKYGTYESGRMASGEAGIWPSDTFTSVHAISRKDEEGRSIGDDTALERHVMKAHAPKVEHWDVGREIEETRNMADVEGRSEYDAVDAIHRAVHEGRMASTAPESIDSWIDRQPWSPAMKAEARQRVQARTERRMNPMTKGEWDAWSAAKGRMASPGGRLGSGFYGTDEQADKLFGTPEATIDERLKDYLEEIGYIGPVPKSTRGKEYALESGQPDIAVEMESQMGWVAQESGRMGTPAEGSFPETGVARTTPTEDRGPLQKGPDRRVSDRYSQAVQELVDNGILDPEVLSEFDWAKTDREIIEGLVGQGFIDEEVLVDAGFEDLAFPKPRYKRGDRVVVSHDQGNESGTVQGQTRGEDPSVTVRFDDGTISSWPASKVRRQSGSFSSQEISQGLQAIRERAQSGKAFGGERPDTNPLTGGRVPRPGGTTPVPNVKTIAAIISRARSAGNKLSAAEVTRFAERTGISRAELLDRLLDAGIEIT
jgi:hypothetical protein